METAPSSGGKLESDAPFGDHVMSRKPYWASRSLPSPGAALAMRRFRKGTWLLSLASPCVA
jgi:hypothetical protein